MDLVRGAVCAVVRLLHGSYTARSMGQFQRIQKILSISGCHFHFGYNPMLILLSRYLLSYLSESKSLFSYLTVYFAGPRYDRESNLCEVQEYMFQFSTLMKSVMSVVICTTIYNAIRFGRVIDLWDQSILSWIVFGISATVLSISFDTAQLFCPFNFEHSLYFKNIPINSPQVDRLVVYGCCYLFPISVSFVFNCLYSFRSHQRARILRVSSIASVAQQLLMYPIALGFAICPLFIFIFLTIFAGHEVRPLLYIGAVIVSSVGTANSYVFFRIVRTSNTTWRQSSQFQEDTKNSSTNPLARRFLSPPSSEVTSAFATTDNSEMSDLISEEGAEMGDVYI